MRKASLAGLALEALVAAASAGWALTPGGGPFAG